MEGEASGSQVVGEEESNPEMVLENSQDSNQDSNQDSSQETDEERKPVEVVQEDEDTRDYDSFNVGGAGDADEPKEEANADVENEADPSVDEQLTAENGDDVDGDDEEIGDDINGVDGDIGDDDEIDANGDDDGNDVGGDVEDEDGGVEDMDSCVSASFPVTPAKSPVNGEALSVSPDAEANPEAAKLMVPPNPLSVPVRKEMTVEDSLVSLPGLEQSV